MTAQLNADPRELDKFGELAHRWWDPNSEFRPLHEINPARIAWIDQHAHLSGKVALDVGCGGGLATEGLARCGARVTGIDLSEKPLGVARLHLFESGLAIHYRLLSAEALADEQPGTFDVVSCLEMLEHVPDPASTIRACAALLKPQGQLFLSTLNRTPKAYLLGILGAEYLLNLLPRGTHDYARFIRPGELARLCREAGLAVEEIIGMRYNPITRHVTVGGDTDINYLLRARK